MLHVNRGSVRITFFCQVVRMWPLPDEADQTLFSFVTSNDHVVLKVFIMFLWDPAGM